MDLFAEVVALTTALDAAGVDYALCGGVALAIHGAPRATRDIALLARGEDLDRLREVARACGFTIEGLPMTFSATGISIRRLAKLAPGGSTVMLDVLIADGALDDVWRSRARIRLDGGDLQVTLSVVSRAGLITLKLAAGRPQDLVDIQRLEEVSRGRHEP